MPKREVVQSITLGRGIKTVEIDGKKVERPKELFKLKPGQVFDFTKEELAEIEAANPNALSKTTTVNLDDGDVDLKKVSPALAKNQKSSPATGGSAGADL